MSRYLSLLDDIDRNAIKSGLDTGSENIRVALALGAFYAWANFKENGPTETSLAEAFNLTQEYVSKGIEQLKTDQDSIAQQIKELGKK